MMDAEQGNSSLYLAVLIFYDVGLLRPGIELTQERRCNRMGTATGNVGYCERLLTSTKLHSYKS